MISSPSTPSDSSATPEDARLSQVGRHPRFWIQGGFYSALGAGLLVLGFMLALRLGTAVLAVVTPFALAGVLALLLDPLVDRLELRGLSRMMGVALIFGTFLFLLVALILLVLPSLITQLTQLSHDGPAYVEKGRAFADNFLSHHRKIGSIELPQNVGALSSKFSERASQLVQNSSGRIAGILLGSVSLIVEGFVVLIATFYLLLDVDRLRARLYYLAPERARGPIAEYSGDVAAVFSSYLRGLMIVCALYGVTTMAIFYAMGFVHEGMRNYALLLGVAAGVLFAVPYVGTISTALVAGLVALVAGGPTFGAVAVGIIIVLNQVFDNVISPRIVGGGVGLHPVLTIFALVLGGELFGLPGLLLSVPVAASLQVILFRLFPKLNSPTPESFLREHGVIAPKAAKATEARTSGNAPQQP